MECKNLCGNELIGRQRHFCSDRCRMAYKRDCIESEQNSNPNKLEPEQTKVEHNPDEVSITELSPGTNSFSISCNPISSVAEIKNFGELGCECRHCQQNTTNKSRHTLNHGAYKTARELEDGKLNRVSLPGDADYEGGAWA